MSAARPVEPAEEAGPPTPEELAALPKRAAHRERPARGARPMAHWTAEEDRVLRTHWQLVGLRTLNALLPGRTAYARHTRARRLGLPMGQPQGTLGIRPLAKLMGVDPKFLRRVLAWAQVKVAVFNYRRAKHIKRFAIDVDDARAAVLRWFNESEPLAAAARARHVKARHLRAWAVAAGHRPLDEGSTWWRLLSSEWDALVAARRPARAAGAISVYAAAKRLDTPRKTLRMALAAAGLGVEQRPLEEFDRVLRAARAAGRCCPRARGAARNPRGAGRKDRRKGGGANGGESTPPVPVP